MKRLKKLLVALIICILIVPCILTAAACGRQSDGISEIEAIYNAYAEAAGENALSYEEWLESIKGEQGSSWLVNAGAPTDSMGRVGDVCLDSTSYDIYQKTETGWTKIGNIKGEKGEDGATWHVGVGYPAIEANEGDFYLDDSNGIIYKMDNGVWTEAGNVSFKQSYTVKFSAQTGGYVSGDTEYVLKSGESVTVTAVADTGYEFVCWSNGCTDETITVTPCCKDIELTAQFTISSLEIPYMVINTENSQAITSKEEYITCEVSVGNSEESYEFSAATGKIRGRGNTSWSAPKKPYKLKFDSKTDLFGNGKAKTWTLIANYFDKSMVRNYLAYSIGSQMSCLEDTTTTTQFVDLYLNGEYQGVYLVCEQVQTGANRVDICEDFTENPADTGYLVELDSKYDGVEGVDYFYVNGVPYSIKGPDFDDIENTDDISKYINYITKYLENCLETLSSGTYDKVCELMDVGTFAETYIVHELFNCVDVGHTSFYLYKDANGKLCSGPLWDFDISSGNCDYSEYANDTDYLWAARNIYYSGLLQYDDFKELVAGKLAAYAETIKSTISQCVEYVYSCSEAFERNFVKWNILGKYVWPNPAELVAIDSWTGQVEYVKEWLLKSLDYLLETAYPYESTETQDGAASEEGAET